METNNLHTEPFVEATDLGMKTPLETPFTHINLSVPLGSFVAVVGDHDSGKTPFLLTVAGRMRFNQGTLKIGGYQLPRNSRVVRKMVGLGLFENLNDLEENLRCSTIMAAELDLYKRPHRKQHVIDYMESWGLGDLVSCKVRELSAFDKVMFGIALGMANDPKMLVVDDVEHSLNHSQTRALVDLLATIAHEQNKIVLVAMNEPSFADGVADHVVHMKRGA